MSSLRVYYWTSFGGQVKIARTLKSELYAPLPQLLEFPWRNSDWNKALEVGADDRGEFTVRLVTEEIVLFEALKEHLPDHRAWKVLDELINDN